MANPTLNFGYRDLWNSASPVSIVCATASYSIGTTRFDTGREWIYLYNGDTQEIHPGYGVQLASGSTGYTVDASFADPSTVSASIAIAVVQNATVPAGYYFWGCRRGFMQVMADGNTSIAAGWHLNFAASGCVDRLTAATGNYINMVRQGYACEAQDTATTASFTAYINCMTAV